MTLSLWERDGVRVYAAPMRTPSIPWSCITLLLLSSSALAGGAFVSGVRQEAVEEPGSTKVLFAVEAGKAYPLVKKGGPGREWCKVKSEGAEGWVKCEGTAEVPQEPRLSGEFLAAKDRELREKEPREPVPEAKGCARTCKQRPLFSAPPELGEVDKEVLGMCPARPDVAVSRAEVERFISKHYEDPRLQRALSAAGRPGSAGGGRQANVEWLAGLWTGTGPRNAFTHVFCGDDWLKDKLGGLHYLPRYAQLEAEGKLCYDGPVRGGQALRGEQYLIRYRGVAPWSCGTKSVGGFARKVDPVEMLAVGTRAFVRCCNRGKGREDGGVYSAPDLGGMSWQIWCGTLNGTYGIATLYPTNERPTCRE